MLILLGGMFERNFLCPFCFYLNGKNLGKKKSWFLLLLEKLISAPALVFPGYFCKIQSAVESFFWGGVLYGHDNRSFLLSANGVTKKKKGGKIVTCAWWSPMGCANGTAWSWIMYKHIYKNRCALSEGIKRGAVEKWSKQQQEKKKIIHSQKDVLRRII